MKISKKEVKYIGGIIVLITILFFLFAPTKISLYIQSLNPILQFAIVNLGIFSFVYIVLRYLVSGKKVFTGALGLLFIFLALDNITPEWHVSASGELLAGAMFGLSSTDYFFGYVWSLLGVEGIWLWIFTYGVTTILLLVGAAYLEKDFIRRLG